MSVCHLCQGLSHMFKSGTHAPSNSLSTYKLCIFDELSIRLQWSFQQYFCQKGPFYIPKCVLHCRSTICRDCWGRMEGMWTEMSYHVLLNNLFTEASRCEKRMPMSQRHAIDGACWNLIHMENSKYKPFTTQTLQKHVLDLQNNMAALNMHPEVTAKPAIACT